MSLRGLDGKHPYYGVIPKWLLTFLGSLYKEVSKTTCGTFMYRFKTIRQEKEKEKILRKTLCPRLRM